ncbi:hypothetical protein F5J12DRAFT_890694 [Pisolithus orientalis]|uniref:uncharacterized protein n=1 Tax=Pisolithus orientalis TaxID=936130 RepID=UPI0022258A63|nr:uncharacterized protein F5J12DRAFT_890694 [Pisolithus orientalis]KAI6015349.1 hypothetical protein F5J12DRAFT_890694 [Pisolithus orientalis]
MTMDTKQSEIVSQSDIWAATFADESQVVGGYDNGEIRRWKIKDGQQQGPTMQAISAVHSIVVSQDGHWMVTGTGDGSHRTIVWNAITHEKVHEFTEHHGWVTALDISHDSTIFATADYFNAQIFSITSGIRLLPPLPHHSIAGIKFSPDASRFATSSCYDGFRVYSTHNGSILFDSGTQGSTGPWSRTPLVWSSDGEQLLIASVGKITRFDLSTSSSSEWLIHENQSPAYIASNGRFIACAAGPSVSLWDFVSHKQISSIITHTSQIKSVALSPSGAYLACGNGRNITVHNLRDVLSLRYFDHGLPLVQVSDRTLKSWTQDDPTNTERLLSEELNSASIPRHYVLANRALIRAHLKHSIPAIEDARESLRVQPSPIGHIAMAVALLGQGDREGALWIFDFASHDCEPHGIRFLLLLKVLGVMYMKKGDYGRAIPLIERAKNLAPEDKQCPPLVTISLIFRWSFDDPDIVSQQCLCETLYAEGRAAEAVEILLYIVKTSNNEIQASKATVAWVADFTKKCIAALEHVGNEAFGFTEHDNAITQNSAVLPPSLAALFIKRSRARAGKGLWEDALRDANEAVKADPSSPWGYEAKHVALHGAKRYDEAIDASKSMLQVIEQSHDPAIRQLRKNYVSPSETIAAIDPVIHGILKNCPLVVIDLTTGRLCDGHERLHIFKADPMFKELVSSTTKEVDNERILRLVARFFGYAMFSHAWQGNEPSFQDVNRVDSKSVWDLPDTPLNNKLRNFCKEARRLGYNWAWSDTCCIDKTTGPILNQSLSIHVPMPGDLRRSFWMTRAWTLQELLSPKAIIFYDSEWKPYLGDIVANHKESPGIMQELADAIQIPHGTIIKFSPDDLGVREKLRLASTRNATVEEDVAYSLIGIFKSDIRPQYGERVDALGHLLEEIVARTSEVTVLAWSGQSSSYNSCLPASISVYSQTPYNPPSLEGEEMETCMTKLRGKLSQENTLSICHQIKFLPPARFWSRRLHLPCIVFPVRKLSIQGLRRGNEKLYRARVSGLGNVEFTTAGDLPFNEPQKFVFAHPWIRHIRGPSSGIAWGGSEFDPESDLDGDAGSDEDAPPSPLHAGSVPHVSDYTLALQMIARLGQPFSALLLVQQPNGEYKRVAAENEIIVSGLGTNITSKNTLATVLEIL